ncbi:MAG: hypothetical protein J6V09_03175 [Clostridia bacterium]|nr:hypothetical protein [Clostridia bacterium]
MQTRKTVSYRDFGAKGDGVTNDFFAMKAAHDYANAYGLSVVADSEDTYLVHDTRSEDGSLNFISIKTDVDWQGANIIIDDTDFIHFDGTRVALENVFKILPDKEPIKIEDEGVLSDIVLKGLNSKTERIAIPGVDYPAMIIPYNTKGGGVYRRIGFSSHFLGGVTREVVVIDKDGNVDQQTPLMFDYDHLDYITVISLAERAITVKNANITTRASHIDILERDGEGKVIRARNGYIARGLKIMRSNTTVQGIKHYVTGEITLAEQARGMLGPTYSGFFAVERAHGVTMLDCVLTGRRCYRKNNVPGAGSGTSGTYDYRADESNKIVFKNCYQSNFWITLDMETGEITPVPEGTPGAIHSLRQTTYGGIDFAVYWGLGGVNYCKNLEFIGSTMSRFDAHQGLYNGKIIDSTYNTISIVGGGNMLVENSTWVGEGIKSGDSLFGMREDYGSPWDGTVTVRNVKAYIFTSRPSYLIRCGYTNWYFGYPVAYPNVVVENLTYYDQETGLPLPDGYEIKLFRFSSGFEPAMHLPTTTASHPYYAKVDFDGDGLIDGTDIPYDGVPSNGGVMHPTSYTNENPVRPPEYIKIIQDGGCRFTLASTAGAGISDGDYYDDVENAGGFFGDTKFYYSAVDYVVGTEIGEVGPFVFN